jgi:hypothetical protein
MNTQKCILCGVEKDLSHFYKHPQMANGHLGRCKDCHRSEIKRNRDENIDRVRAYDRERSKTLNRKLLNVEKNRIKRKNEEGMQMAHNLVSRAIKNGKLIRPDHCSSCLINCSPQAHHDDYSKPLEIIWLCPICHADRHRKLGRLGKGHRS